MKFLLRKFLVVLALAVAVSPAMAKDTKKTGKTVKAKSGLFAKKKSAAKKGVSGKSQYKRITVNINKANAAALSAYLMGIGPTRAKAIVSYRGKNGKFSATKELMEVDGIGEAIYAGLKKNVSTSRGETSAPKGYKMGEASGKTGTKKKSASALKRKKATDTKGKAGKKAVGLKDKAGKKMGDKKAKAKVKLDKKKPKKLKKVKKPTTKAKKKTKKKKKAKK